MDLLGNLALGFATASTLANIGFCLIGVLLGTLIGVLPGIGATATIAMPLPIAFQIAAMRGLRWISERILPRSLVEVSVRSVFGDPAKATQDKVDRYVELNLRVGNRRALF